MKLHQTIALLTLSLTTLGCAASGAGAAPPYPTLKRDGEVLPSVCVPAELEGLKAQFQRYQYKDAETAWKAVIVLLCGNKTDESTRYIEGMMAATLTATSDYTGQDNPTEALKASKEVAESLFASGVAFDASIANLPGGMFRVLFATNQVCGESRIFKYEKKKWFIVGKGEACD